MPQVVLQGGVGLPPQNAVLVTSGPILNLSGINLNVAKWQQMPPNWVPVDGYKESVRGNNDTEAVIIWQGPWGTRLAFYQWALGYASNTQDPNNPNGGILTRNVPAQHPEMPWLYGSDVELLGGQGIWINNPNVFLLDATGAPFLDANGNAQINPMPAYTDAGTGSDGFSCSVAVHYRVKPYEVRTDTDVAAIGPTNKGELERWVSRQKKFAIKGQTLSGLLQWYEGPYAGNTIPDNAAQKIYPLQELVYTWWQAPDVPEVAIGNAIGLVNANPFDGARGASTYAAGTLLLQPVDTPVRERNVVGRVTWTITYRMLYNPIASAAVGGGYGWNVLPAADGLAYGASFGGAVGGNRLYKSVDFATLFKMPTPVNYQ